MRGWRGAAAAALLIGAFGAQAANAKTHAVHRQAAAKPRAKATLVLSANPLLAFQQYTNTYVIPNHQGTINGTVMNLALGYISPIFSSMGSWDSSGNFTLAGSAVPAPTASVRGGVKSSTAPTGSFVTGVTTSGDLTFAASGGGITPFLPVSHQFLTGFNGTSFSAAQPTATDISGLASSATTDTTNAGNISSGTLPAARLPTPTSVTRGGVLAASAGANQFQSGIDASGTPIFAQPSFLNLSGSATCSQMPALTGDTTTLAGSCATTTTKTNGVAFASSATTDTTNAANISSGTLPAARLPAPAAATLGGVKSAAGASHQFMTGIDLTGAPTFAQPVASDVSGLAASATVDATNAANISTGTLPAARLPTPAVSSLGGVSSLTATSHQFVTGLSTAGSLTTAQPAAADISGLAASATTDATNATNISSGSLACARLPALTGDVSRTAGSCATTVTGVNGATAGSAANASTGTSGHAVPFLDGSNTFSGNQTFTGNLVATYGTLPGSGTNGQIYSTSGGFYAYYGSAWHGPFSTSGINSTTPTTQKFTTGSGTYTTPAGVSWIEGWIIGGGAGGGGGGTSAGNGTAGNPTCWNTSGAACTSPVYQAGGGSAGGGASNVGSAGGTVSGSGTCIDSIPGGGSQAGGASVNGSFGGAGGMGGNSSQGGGGLSATGGGAANTGGGGAGGSSGNGVTSNAGAGGGAGATCRFIISNPAATYTYAVGGTAAGGTAGTGGAAGGAGAAGKILIVEHYNP